MDARRLRIQIAASALALLTACGRPVTGGPVTTPSEAGDVARQALRAAGLDEEVVDIERQGRSWVVTTRWRETSVAGHVVTIDAATGAVAMERYRTLQLGGRR